MSRRASLLLFAVPVLLGAADPSASDLREVLRTNGLAQKAALLKLVPAPRGPAESRWNEFDEWVFYHERRLRPALRSLLPDPEVGTPARSLLALIGVPEDLRLAVQLAPPSRKLEANYWAYALSSALLQPDCDEEWDFLRRCALGDYRVSPRPPDTTVEASTIQTLALIDTPRSRAILEEVRHKNSHRAASIARMIQTIQSHPSPLAGPDPKELARRLGRTLEMGDFERAEKPWYNETGDKVLIDLYFIDDAGWQMQTFTFHKADGVWHLRGVRPTMAAIDCPCPQCGSAR